MKRKELKAYIKFIIGMFVISAIILYFICLFNECNLIQAVQMKETSFYVWGAVLLNLWTILSLVIMLVTEKIKLPSVPGGTWKEEELLVCRYNGFTYITLFLLCLVMSLLMMGGAVANFISGVIEGGVALAGCSLIILAPGIVLWLYITRCVLIFYPMGLVYRDLRGNVYHVTDEEVQYVLPIGYGKNRCFKLKTKERTIILGIQARHFYEAEAYAIKKYPQVK